MIPVSTSRRRRYDASHEPDLEGRRSLVWTQRFPPTGAHYDRDSYRKTTTATLTEMTEHPGVVDESRTSARGGTIGFGQVWIVTGDAYRNDTVTSIATPSAVGDYQSVLHWLT